MILTTTDFPLCVTRTLVPKGKVRCAAVNALGLNRSPFAVILLLLHCPGVAQSYQDAIVALAGAAIKNAAAIKVSSNFIFLSLILVTTERFKLPTLGFEDRCSIR